MFEITNSTLPKKFSPIKFKNIGPKYLIIHANMTFVYSLLNQNAVRSSDYILGVSFIESKMGKLTLLEERIFVNLTSFISFGGSHILTGIEQINFSV